MPESTPVIPNPPQVRPARHVQDGIPPDKAQRDALLAAVRRYVREQAPTAPLSLAELREHCGRLIEETGADEQWRDWLAVLLSNEVWRDQLAGIPCDRRLLLLPQCLRDPAACQGSLDPIGLLCKGCGACPIRDIQAEAERLGYVVLVAEGSPVVMSLLESGQVQAVVGVSCLETLERIFPYIHAAAVPGIAIPLLAGGCHETTLDIDWLWEAMHLTSENATRRLDLDALRAQVKQWFEPAAIDETLGPAEGETDRIARDWLARGGKRWRPFLAVCAYRALTDDKDDEPGNDDDLRKLALAVECFHKASLVHDDIEDADETRYDGPALHVEHGQPVALNVGDLLLGEGYRLIAECRCANGRKVEMLRTAAEGHRTLCQGQGAELCWARKQNPLTVAQVLDIFRRKTAPAFHVALHLGATLAGADRNVHEVLANYSEAMGIAYQIRDDLEDFTADPHAPNNGDGPNILLALAGEAAAGDGDARLVDELWQGTNTAPDSEVIARLFDRTGARRQATERMESYKQRALECLDGLDNASLKGLLRRVITRIFDDTRKLFCCEDRKNQ